MASTRTRATKPPALTRLYRREYSIWAGMHQRRKNPRCREYPYYGGRGIRVCRSWSGKNGFKHFIADMGPQPFPRASVHRKNNDGNYRPENVIWANPKIKARNMRPNRTLSYKGKCMILVEWAEFLGMKAGTLGARLTKGWSMEEALTRPVKPWHRRGTP